jgi:glycosyltransferase involved in cell wall biosynthesis
MAEPRFISVVIPTRNGAAVLGRCLAAAFASRYPRFEVVVVDDASEDDSLEIIARFPCRLVRLDQHSGASKARNAGAGASRGELLFFIDSDCMLGSDTLALANESFGSRKDRVLGGTYTPLPADDDFYSAFQSISIHHLETRTNPPDYVAAHAMVIDAGLFRRSGGFVENSFIGRAASVEDVELCHRLRRSGCELSIDPRLQVTHIFRFSLLRSVRNAFRKASYWTTYSMANGDMLADSGAASRQLKASVFCSLAVAALVSCAAAGRVLWPLLPAAALLGLPVFINRSLIAAWRAAKGPLFCLQALSYYLTVYAFTVAAGGLAGAARYVWTIRLLRRYPPCTPRFGTLDPAFPGKSPST